jgi:hypothetical protein
MNEHKFFIEKVNESKPEIEFEIYKYRLSLNPILSGELAKVITTASLSDEIFNLLFQTNHDSVLTLLAQNSSLTDEKKAQLALLGFKQAENRQNSQAGYFETDITSLIFPYVNSSDNGLCCNRGSEIALPIVAETLYAFGHPYSILDTSSALYSPEISENAFEWLLNREYLHRIFWRELSELVEDFDIYYRYGIENFALFVSHPILEKDFEDFEYEDLVEGSIWGAIFEEPDGRNWVSIFKNPQMDLAVDEIRGRSEESFFDRMEERQLWNNGDYDLYILVLAFLTYGNYGENGMEKKYGVQLTPQGESRIADSVVDSIQYDMLDIDVSINYEYPENLTWKNLQSEKQRQLFELLVIGLKSESEKLTGNAEHFLGCIALHPDTPSDILSELQTLNNPFINEVLETR